MSIERQEALLDENREALKSVHRHGAMSFRQAVIADRSGCVDAVDLKELDDRDCFWWEVPERILLKHQVLPMFDPQAWQYFLPAYMSAAIRNLDDDPPVVGDTVWSLGTTKKAIVLPGRFERLTEPQRWAVAKFLVLDSDTLPDYERDVKRALTRYWCSALGPNEAPL